MEKIGIFKKKKNFLMLKNADKEMKKKKQSFYVFWKCTNIKYLRKNGELKVYLCRKNSQIITNDCDFFYSQIVVQAAT